MVLDLLQAPCRSRWARPTAETTVEIAVAGGL
jgi:hypothetical protein